MDVDHVPELIGDGVRLRPLRGSDIARRAALGRSREIAYGFGEDLEADEPMTEPDAADELSRRYGPGPHWVIADRDDEFVGVVRLAPVDAANRSARLGIGILDRPASDTASAPKPSAWRCAGDSRNLDCIG